MTRLLQSWLAPTRHDADAAVPGMRLLGRHVLARGLCRLRRVSLEGIAPRDRLGRLRIEAAQWRPFDDADHAAWLQGDAAWLFAWDRAAFDQRLTALGRAPRVAQVLPETLLAPPMPGDGLRLLRCSQGFEGQVWQGGQLTACRWWPQEPDTGEWQGFVRGAGLSAIEQKVPATTLPGPLPAPGAWKAARLLSAAGGAQGQTAALAAAVLAVVFAAPAALVARDHWVVHQEIEQLTLQHDALQADAAPVLSARREALDGLSNLERTVAWLSTPDPIQALAQVARQLPPDGSVIREFEFTQDQLRLALAPGRGTPRVTYVRALEEGGHWQQVREETGEGAAEGLLLLRARLAPAKAAATSAASAAAAASAGGAR